MRALKERQRATTAPTPAIRGIHLDLAIRYEQLASEMVTANELRSSNMAVARSMALLRNTAALVDVLSKTTDRQ
jgi:hypothetical protein